MPQDPASVKPAPRQRRPARKRVTARPKFIGRTPANLKGVDPKEFPTRDPKFIGRTKAYPKRTGGK